MYIKIEKKKYDVIYLNTFWLKLKSLKFYLEPIEDIYMMRRKGLTTYWFCQNVDIIETDKDNKIVIKEWIARYSITFFPIKKYMM